MIKLIIEIIETKGDKYGNYFTVARITNTHNGKQLITSTPHASNVTSILQRAGFTWGDLYTSATHETTSTKESSLPKTTHDLNPCNYSKEWKKALNSIGLRNLNLTT